MAPDPSIGNIRTPSRVRIGRREKRLILWAGRAGGSGSSIADEGGFDGADPRLRLRRVRHAVRRALGGRSWPRRHRRSYRSFDDVAAEATRVHVAPGPDGEIRGLLGGDGGGAPLRDPAARAPCERGGRPTA